MGIYTKKGDKGDTSLYGGSRLSKGSLRVDSYGSVDEANANLGVIHANLEFEELKEIIRVIQKKMFIVGAQLASDKEGHEKLKVKIESSDIKYLENIIDYYTKEYGALSGFIIPGETVASSQLHVARTVVRRSERLAVNLSKEEFVCPLILKYLNRLSDTLFILARVEVQKSFIKKVVEKIYEAQGESQTILEVKNDSSNIFDKKLLDEMYRAVVKISKDVNVPVCFSVADEFGNLIYFARDEKAILPSINISQNKAYTSSVLKMTTEALGELAGAGGSLFGINVNDPKIVIFGGGQCLIKNGKVLGAIGVSGGSVEEDILIGKAAIKIFEDRL